MPNIYVFDMDGTLTPARKPMEAEFAIQFYEWQKTHKSFIATGSDYKKVEEQLPPSVIGDFRSNTEYKGQLYPNYIEHRIGMVNFSVLGRDCPYAERERYAAWDRVANERIKIQQFLLNKFPDLDIAVGGSISIDITPKGFGKGQIAKHLRNTYPNEKIIFFGDKTYAGGNDYELAQALTQLNNTSVVQVNNPDDVLTFLKNNERA